MQKKQMKRTSQFISMLLRHKPEAIGITLDEHGWADVQELINGTNKHSEYSRDLRLVKALRKTRKISRKITFITTKKASGTPVLFLL